jgi:thiol-disulfide isomerase/thioredoxin
VFDPIYLLTTHRDYLFDRQQGVVRKITTTYKQGWPAGRSDDTSVQTIELTGSRQLDDAEAAALRGEVEIYFAARERYGKLAMRASQEFAHAAELYDEAAAELKKLDGELKLPEMRALFEQRLKQHNEYTPFEVKSAERFAKLLDKPSEEWKTTDLDGNPRSLADYRGKVVILDFWYRGCGWCIRSMPQLNQLAADFPADQVLVLGINNDLDLDDAKFVIDKMPLKYTSLKNAPDGDRRKGINTLYGVQGWPTLVVLDGQGVVRHIHEGYSPTLRKDLGEKIRELLADKKSENSEK